MQMGEMVWFVLLLDSMHSVDSTSKLVMAGFGSLVSILSAELVNVSRSKTVLLMRDSGVMYLATSERVSFLHGEVTEKDACGDINTFSSCGNLPSSCRMKDYRLYLSTAGVFLY